MWQPAKLPAHPQCCPAAAPHSHHPALQRKAQIQLLLAEVAYSRGLGYLGMSQHWSNLSCCEPFTRSSVSGSTSACHLQELHGGVMHGKGKCGMFLCIFSSYPLRNEAAAKRAILATVVSLLAPILTVMPHQKCRCKAPVHLLSCIFEVMVIPADGQNMLAPSTAGKCRAN